MAVIDKSVASVRAAVADIGDGASVMIGGFGTAGMPDELIEALIDRGVGDLTIINNNAGNGETGVAALIKAGRCARSSARSRASRIASFRRALPRRGNRAGTGAARQPCRADPGGRSRAGRDLHAHRLWHAAGRRQGNAPDRRARLCAGIPDPRRFRADQGAPRRSWGNLVYRKTARNFGPIMAMAARTAIVQVDEIVPLGSLDPETVVTPGIFVQRVVALGASVARAA
jgi:3-oxoadipate CoA-transferase alpha subunit